MKKFSLLTSASILAMVAAYDSGTPGWKKDDNGNVVMKDGNPVYLHSSGQEQTVNGNTIADLNTEAKTYRIAKEAAEKSLEAFKGIDPEIARKAIELSGKIDAKTLIDAGKVDEVKKQITDQYTAQLSEKDKALVERDNKINDMLISDVFKSSEFLRDGIAVPRDFVEAAFRGNFKIEDGKIAAYDKSGNRLMSKEKMGEFASGDEALKMMVELHPNKDQIMKADVGNGSGNGGGGGSRGKGAVVKRAEFDKMSPAQQGETAGKARAGELSIVD